MKIVKLLILVLIIILININHINNLYKNIIYILIFLFIITNRIERFSINTNELLENNKYDIKSYDNVEHKTFDFYKKNMEKTIRK